MVARAARFVRSSKGRDASSGKWFRMGQDPFDDLQEAVRSQKEAQASAHAVEPEAPRPSASELALMDPPS